MVRSIRNMSNKKNYSKIGLFTLVILLFQALYSCNTMKKNTVKTVISTNKNVFKIGEPIKLSMEVKNEGDNVYTFLPWGTPTENRFTRNCLSVTYNNKLIDYTGLLVKRKPPTEKNYITLKKDESFKGNVNLFDGYQLVKKGIFKIKSENPI